MSENKKTKEKGKSKAEGKEKKEGVYVSKKFVNVVAAIVIFVVGALFGYALTSTSPSSSVKNVVGEETGSKLIENTLKDFILNQYGQEVDVKVVNINNTGTYYEALVQVTGAKQPMPVYLSLDGKKIFFQAMDTKSTVSKNTQGVENKTNKPEMDISVMAFCPFGNQVEDALIDVIKLFHNVADFVPHYIFYEGKDPYGREDTEVDGKHYWSLHGNYELEEGVREKIIYELYGPVKWIEFVVAVNNNCTKDNIDTCWKEQAQKLGIEVNKVEQYYNKHWKEIVQEEAKYSKEHGITGSPTITLNGEQYKSPRRTPEAFREFVCGGFINPPQTLCDENKSLSDVQNAASGSCN